MTIGELVRELLREADPGHFGAILARYTIPGPDLAPYIRWNKRHYTRNCVVRNHRFELLVICFEPGQRTSIHDHDCDMALVHPLMGRLLEEHYRQRSDGELVLDRSVLLSAGDLGTLTRDNPIHRFTNPGPGRSIMLNLYVPPLRRWRVYDGGGGPLSPRWSAEQR